MAAPVWLSLLAPLPDDAKPERKLTAPAELIASGKAAAIEGWHNVTVHLSAPDFGLRNLHALLDEKGQLLSGGDHVMFIREVDPGRQVSLSDHESIGGRFEDDGSFRGTCWKSRLKSVPDSDEAEIVSNESSTPTDDQIAALRRLIDDMLRRV